MKFSDSAIQRLKGSAVVVKDSVSTDALKYLFYQGIAL